MVFSTENNKFLKYSSHCSWVKPAITVQALRAESRALSAHATIYTEM